MDTLSTFQAALALALRPEDGVGNVEIYLMQEDAFSGSFGDSKFPYDEAGRLPCSGPDLITSYGIVDGVVLKVTGKFPVDGEDPEK